MALHNCSRGASEATKTFGSEPDEAAVSGPSRPSQMPADTTKSPKIATVKAASLIDDLVKDASYSC